MEVTMVDFRVMKPGRINGLQLMAKVETRKQNGNREQVWVERAGRAKANCGKGLRIKGKIGWHKKKLNTWINITKQKLKTKFTAGFKKTQIRSIFWCLSCLKTKEHTTQFLNQVICIEKFMSMGHKDVIIKESNKNFNYDRILKVAVNWRQAAKWPLRRDFLDWDC